VNLGPFGSGWAAVSGGYRQSVPIFGKSRWRERWHFRQAGGGGARQIREIVAVDEDESGFVAGSETYWPGPKRGRPVRRGSAPPRVDVGPPWLSESRAWAPGSSHRSSVIAVLSREMKLELTLQGVWRRPRSAPGFGRTSGDFCYISHNIYSISYNICMPARIQNHCLRIQSPDLHRPRASRAIFRPRPRMLRSSKTRSRRKACSRRERALAAADLPRTRRTDDCPGEAVAGSRARN
jgi:hypothetical protein